MKLDTHIPRVVLQLQDLHTNTLVILADEVKTSFSELLDVVGVDFISVTMTLLDLELLAVELAETRPFASRLEDGWAETETHCSAEGGLVDFGHEDDEWVGTLFVQLDGRCTSDTAYVTSEFDDGDLHAETDT